MKITYYFYIFIAICLVTGAVMFFSKDDVHSVDAVKVTKAEINELLELSAEARAGFFYDKKFERREDAVNIEFHCQNETPSLFWVRLEKGDPDLLLYFKDGGEYENFLKQFTGTPINRRKDFELDLTNKKWRLLAHGFSTFDNAYEVIFTKLVEFRNQ